MSDKKLLNEDALKAIHDCLPKKGLIATFNTSDFYESSGHYQLENISLTNYIDDSDMLIICWDGCYALCPIPDNDWGYVIASMTDKDTGMPQIVTIAYRLFTVNDNKKLDIGLSPNFTPPTNYSGYVKCAKIFN